MRSLAPRPTPRKRQSKHARRARCSPMSAPPSEAPIRTCRDTSPRQYGKSGSVLRLHGDRRRIFRPRRAGLANRRRSAKRADRFDPDGSPAAYQRIRTGTYEIGTIPEPAAMQGWQAMDEMNRALDKRRPAASGSPCISSQRPMSTAISMPTASTSRRSTTAPNTED